jgi:hypothetical protein
METNFEIVRRGGRAYNVRIAEDDGILNLIHRAETARLVCTCPDFQAEGRCNETRLLADKFERWRTGQIRRLRAEVAGRGPVDVLAAAYGDTLGVELSQVTFIDAGSGQIALQWDPGLARRYAPNCAWGTFGQSVYLGRSWPDAGILGVVMESGLFSVWQPDIEFRLMLDRELPPLPPIIIESDEGLAPRRSGMGRGLVALNEAPVAEQANGALDWPSFWCALAGLELDSLDVHGDSKGLFTSTVKGEALGGLALDVAEQRVKMIPESQIDLYSEGVPQALRNSIAHAHLPWGPEGAATAAYQVIVRSPNRATLNPREAVLVLTANFWLGGCGARQAGPVLALVAQAAGHLLRLGHVRSAICSHGEEYRPLNDWEAKNHTAAEGLHWDVCAEAWETLRNDVLPRLRQGGPVEHGRLARLEHGPDWGRLLPPTGD